jgi:hypothetical protein
MDARARLLAVEVLLAEPESLGNDALETDLYLLRDQLMALPGDPRPRHRRGAVPVKWIAECGERLIEERRDTRGPVLGCDGGAGGAPAFGRSPGVGAGVDRSRRRDD